MKKILLVICCCSLFACAPYAPTPAPLKDGMITPFQADAAIKIVNSQSKDDFRITRYGGVPVNLKETTATTIAFLQAELAKNGVQVSPVAAKEIRLSVDELYQVPYSPPMTEICRVSCTLETGSGLKKQFRENDVSGLDIFHACNFALTKVVAAIVNDEEVRRFIDPQLKH